MPVEQSDEIVAVAADPRAAAAPMAAPNPAPEGNTQPARTSKPKNFGGMKKRTQNRKAQQVADSALSACATADDALQLMSKVVARMDKKFPGLKNKLSLAGKTDCRCEVLVQELGSMRQEWKHHNLPVARAVDRVVRVAGYKAKRLQQLGYVTSETQARLALRRGS